jgi:hypothetical protein
MMMTFGTFDNSAELARQIDKHMTSEIKIHVATQWGRRPGRTLSREVALCVKSPMTIPPKAIQFRLTRTIVNPNFSILSGRLCVNALNDEIQ